MLSLSKKTDYGLLALSHLTKLKDGEAASARELATEYSIPTELLAKIMQRLARADIVRSLSGPSGGYRLSRPANEISIASVIGAIEGTTAFTQCTKSDGSDCDQMTKCTIRKPLAHIHARILQMLSLITLAEFDETEVTTYPVVLMSHATKPRTTPANAAARPQK